MRKTKMKIHVCDVCKGEDRQLVQTNRYLSVKRRPNLRIDLCEKHMLEVSERFPKITSEYIQYVYGLRGMKLTEERAKDILKWG